MQPEFTPWDSYNNRYYMNETGWYNRQNYKVHNTRNWSHFREGYHTDLNLSALGLPIDSQVLKQNSRKIMQKLNEFQTVDEFFAWMKQRFQHTTSTDKVYDCSNVVKETYPSHGYYSLRDQEFRSHYPRGSQSGFHGNVTYYPKQTIALNEPYTYPKGSNGFKEGYYSNSQLPVNVSNMNRNKYNFPPKYQYYLKDSHRNAARRETNDAINVEKLTEETCDNLRTAVGQENNRKRKHVQNKHKVDLTASKAVDIPLNLSKNTLQEDENVSVTVEDDYSYFAPCDDYESDLEYIDEDSLFAKHQREYYKMSEAKRLKTSHKDSYGSKNADNYPYALPKSSSSESTTKVSNVKHDRKAVYEQDNAEESVARRRNGPDPYIFYDVSQQNEAIDYSVKLENRPSPGTKLNSKYKGKKVTSRNLGNAKGGSSHVSKDCFERFVEVKDKRNVKAPVKSVTSERRCSPKRLTTEKLDEHLSNVGQEKIGYINSVAKLGFCFPLAQNKVTSILKKKSVEEKDFHKVAPIYKTLSKEWFETLLKECMRSLNEKVFEDENDAKKGESVSSKHKKTLEDVIDTMITDMMDGEDDF